MSNSLAVATVTSALLQLLNQAVKAFPGGARVTVRPPDKARLTPPVNQLNVFLYHTTLDPAWRNQDMPTIRPGETGFPPLPLVLHYVITAYGEGDEDDIKAHQLLGRAMSVLHDHPILGPDEFTDLVTGTDLQDQLERVRVTAQVLTVDDMYKLWTAFQTQYRISAAYEVSVVLIDSTQPNRTPLPVLTRGANDSGPVAQAAIEPPFPTLEAITLPDTQLVALIGDRLTLTGHHLTGASGVRFIQPGDRPAAATHGPGYRHRDRRRRARAACRRDMDGVGAVQPARSTRPREQRAAACCGVQSHRAARPAKAGCRRYRHCHSHLQPGGGPQAGRLPAAW